MVKKVGNWGKSGIQMGNVGGQFWQVFLDSNFDFIINAPIAASRIIIKIHRLFSSDWWRWSFQQPLDQPTAFQNSFPLGTPITIAPPWRAKFLKIQTSPLSNSATNNPSKRKISARTPCLNIKNLFIKTNWSKSQSKNLKLDLRFRKNQKD